jgi:hypothetical protein
MFRYGFNETVFIEHYKILFSKLYFTLARRKPVNKRKTEEIPIFDYDYESDEDWIEYIKSIESSDD